MQSKVIFVIVLSAFVGSCYGSAIPVWELLKNEEKVQYIYSIFAKQVETLCESIKSENCNQELLKYGLGVLKEMTVEELDAVDPYQRNSKQIIWGAIMQNHELGKTTPKTQSSTTPKPNSYEDDIDELKNDNLYKITPPKGFIQTEEPILPEVVQIIPINDDDAESLREFLVTKIEDIQ